jgi:hypothetical protein
MAMVPFYTRFPELAARETRTATVLDPASGFPPGEYGFLELFCDEPGCDCRRVHIRVVSPPPQSRVWANISYGWESVAFYHRWGLPEGEEATGTSLDPLNVQSEYAPAFLDLFREMVRADETYAQRLVRHHELFKSALPARPAKNRPARRRQKPAPGRKRKEQ